MTMRQRSRRQTPGGEWVAKDGEWVFVPNGDNKAELDRQRRGQPGAQPDQAFLRLCLVIDASQRAERRQAESGGAYGGNDAASSYNNEPAVPAYQEPATQALVDPYRQGELAATRRRPRRQLTARRSSPNLLAVSVTREFIPGYGSCIIGTRVFGYCRKEKSGCLARAQASRLSSSVTLGLVFDCTIGCGEIASALYLGDEALPVLFLRVAQAAGVFCHCFQERSTDFLQFLRFFGVR